MPESRFVYMSSCFLSSVMVLWFCCQEVVDYIISDILSNFKAGLVLTGNIGAAIFMFSLQLL